MTTIRKVEDIDAWQEARALARLVYQVTSEGSWAKDFGLRDQIRRAAVSIASNIAEGYARDSGVEFKRFLAIARGSAAEIKTQLYIGLDLGYIGQADFDGFYERIDRISRMLTGLMRYLSSAGAAKPPTANRQPTTENQ